MAIFLLLLIISAVENLKVMDERYKISENTAIAGEKAKAKMQELDEKYEITARTNALITAGVQKVREIDESHHLTQRANTMTDGVLAYAREIDARYAVSATAARLVQQGKEAIIMAYHRAVQIDRDHRITERAGNAIVAGAHLVAQQVTKLSSSATTPASADDVAATAVVEGVAVDDASAASEEQVKAATL